MIRFQCHQCGKKLKAPEEYAGRAVQCTGCGSVQAVPAVEAPPAETRTQTIHPASPLEYVQPAAAAEAGEESPLLERKTGMTDDGLDMTPMVDVTFLLLIFFMVTAAFALQRSIQIPTPAPSASAAASRT